MDTFERIAEVARGMGIIDISVASASAWDSNPLVSSRIGSSSRPAALMDSAKSVIVIGIPIQKAIIDTAPSIYYHSLYDTVNAMLDHAGERIALELGILGHDAVYVPRDGYHGIKGLQNDPSAFFSHRHAAYLAGMGTFGYNNMILTEKYGPRIRFTSIITSAELTPKKPMSKELCVKCKKCTKACPGEALGNLPYPNAITLKEKCVAVSTELAAKGISPCGRCIAICPVGKDYGSGLPSEEAKANIRKYVK